MSTPQKYTWADINLVPNEKLIAQYDIDQLKDTFQAKMVDPKEVLTFTNAENPKDLEVKFTWKEIE